MKIIVDIDVTIQRADGTESRLGETTTYMAGDNPRFVGEETAKAIRMAAERAITGPGH